MKKCLLLLSALSSYGAYTFAQDAEVFKNYTFSTEDPTSINWSDIVWEEADSDQNRDRYYLNLSNAEESNVYITGGTKASLNVDAAIYLNGNTNLIIGDANDTETSEFHLISTNNKDTFIEVCNYSSIIVNKNGVLTIGANKQFRTWNAQNGEADPNKPVLLVDGGTVNGNLQMGDGANNGVARYVFKNGATLNRNIEVNPMRMQNLSSLLFDNSTYNVWNADNLSYNNGFGNHVFNIEPNNQRIQIDAVLDNGSVANGAGFVTTVDGVSSVEYFDFKSPITNSGINGADLSLQVNTMTSEDSYFRFSLLNGSKLSAKGIKFGHDNTMSTMGEFTFTMQGKDAENISHLAAFGGTQVNLSRAEKFITTDEGEEVEVENNFVMNFLMKGNAKYETPYGDLNVGRNETTGGTFNLFATGDNNYFAVKNLHIRPGDMNVISDAKVNLFFGCDDQGNVATNSFFKIQNFDSHKVGSNTQTHIKFAGATNTFEVGNINMSAFDDVTYDGEVGKFIVEVTDGAIFTTTGKPSFNARGSGDLQFIVSNGAEATVNGFNFRASTNDLGLAPEEMTKMSVIVDGATLKTTANLDYASGDNGDAYIILKGDKAYFEVGGGANLNQAGTDARRMTISLEGTNGTFYGTKDVNINGNMTEDYNDNYGGYYVSMTGSGNLFQVGNNLNFMQNDKSTGGTYELYMKSDSADAKNVFMFNNNLDLHAYYSGDAENPDGDGPSTMQKRIILAGNSVIKRTDEARFNLHVMEYNDRIFNGGNALVEISGSGNELVVAGLKFGNGSSLEGTARLRIVGGGSLIDANNFRIQGNHDLGTSIDAINGGVLEYVLDSTGISTIVINNGIDTLNGVLEMNFEAMADGSYVDSRYVLMSSAADILQSKLEEYWIDFTTGAIKDDTLVSIISSGAEDEDYRFAMERNSETDAYEFVLYYTANVPEPATFAMIFGALALGFATYRKRK